MKLLALIVLALLLLILAFLFLNLKIYFKFFKESEKDEKIEIKLGLFGGLIRFKLPLDKKGKKKAESVEKPQKKKVSVFTKIKKVYNLIGEYKEAFFYLQKKLSCISLSFLCEVGFKKPHETGEAIGLFYALSGVLLAFARNLIAIKKEKIEFKPDFNSPGYKICAECIFQIRPVNIIKVLMIIRKGDASK